MFQTIRKVTGLIILFSVLNIAVGSAQQSIDKMTKEDVMAMSYDQLADFSLEDLMKLADIVGVSIDDLFNMVLNKDVTIASKSSESFFDTPLSTSVLSADDIARSGVTSIPEAMRLIPGIIVREKTNGNYDIHIRGNDNIPYGQQTIFSENTLTLVMIDGRVVYNYSTGGTFWESLPIGINDIDRIEVVRGPASALYGPNAVSGVINIITKNVDSKKPSVNAQIQSGNRFGSMPSGMATSGSQNLSVSFGIKNHLKFRVSGNYDYRDRAQEDVYIWKDENQNLPIPASGYYPVDSVMLVGADPNAMYIDPSISLDAYSFNGYMFYDPNPNVSINLSAGLQHSIALSSNTDIGFVTHTTREMETKYADLRASIHGFNLQSNYMWGHQNVSVGTPGYEFDLSAFNLNLDYNFQLLNESLSIRPGFSFARSVVTDEPYLQPGKQSFLNGEAALSSFAPSVRLDYKPIEQLRFVGAFRYEKNKYPDKGYPTWQLVANYRVKENSSVRAVYSRANRSPFMLDIHANASIIMKYPITLADASPLIPYPFSEMMIHSDDPSDEKNRFTADLDGNKNLNLAVMDMVELGYRQKLGQHILLNFELFYSKLRNMSAMDADAIKMTNVRAVPNPYYDPSDPQFGPEYMIPPNAAHYTYEQHNIYQNIKEVAKQTGATAEIGVVINRAWNFRLFGTLQQTNLENHSGYNGMRVKTMENAAKSDPSVNWTTDNINWTWAQVTDSLVNTNNKATPSFYGGFELNWLPTDKWTITSTGYGFSKQTFTHQYGSFDIKSKMLVNLRVSYKFTRNSSVFMTVNNIFDSTSQEFGFMDKTGAVWYWGVNVKF